MSALLRAGVAACLAACIFPAWGETKSLSFTAQITQINRVAEFTTAPPAYFQLGMSISGQWLLESGQPGASSTVLSTDWTIGDVHLRSVGGSAANITGDFFAWSAYPPFSDGPTSAQWDYADPAWIPNFMAMRFLDAAVPELPWHVLPDASHLAAAPIREAIFCTGAQKVAPEYCYFGQITSFTMTDVSPVPEPGGQVLFLAGAALLLVQRRWQRTQFS